MAERPTLSRRITYGPHADERERLGALVPYLSETRAPAEPSAATGPEARFRVATYNVHRWTGVVGGRAWAPEKAVAVIAELAAKDVEVLALQEVLRPFGGPDPLADVADAHGLYLAFVTTRLHRRGELGNAVLSRWPLAGALAIDLSFGRMEQRAAIATQFRGPGGSVTIAATHLAIVDRTRERQVHALLSHPQLSTGPVVLLGDMNAWRTDPAARHLRTAFAAAHHNEAWPPSYPSVAPVLALDRCYARGAVLSSVRAHETAAARRGSDHLPILATVRLDP